MEFKTKKIYEFDSEDITLLENFERRYKVKVIICDGKRVEKYQVEQSIREAHRTACFKDVKVPLEEQINLRFWYYKELFNIPRKEVIKRLCSDFIRGENTIEQYLMGGRRILNDVENKIDIDTRMPIFDWSVHKRAIDLSPIVEYSKEERKIKREEAITAYYYFYGDLLEYTDIDREYIICYRDFDISPKCLGRILSRNRKYLYTLKSNKTTVEELRLLFPMFAWNTSLGFRIEDEIPDNCDIVLNSLKEW